MEQHILGRTGVSVSKLCLGTMMFGAWGNPDHDESIRIIHAALDAGINFVDTADVYAARRVRGDRRQGARRRPARRRRPGHEVPRRDGRRPEPAGQLAPLDHPRGRGLAAPPRHRLDRPLPGAPPAHRHRHRGDARRPHRPRAPGQGPLHRLLDLPRQPDRRGAVGRARPAPRSASSPSSRPTRSSSARSRPTSCPTCDAPRHGRPVLQPADRRLALGPLAQGRRAAVLLARRAGCRSASTSRQPANQRKLDAVEQLAQLADEAGITLIQLAIAFVLNHPAITAADHRPAHDGAAREPARGRRRRRSTRRCSTGSTRSSPPGTTINPVDNSFDNPALRPTARRR